MKYPTTSKEVLRTKYSVRRGKNPSSVVDLKLFFSDPDPTFQEISVPDPAPKASGARNYGFVRLPGPIILHYGPLLAS